MKSKGKTNQLASQEKLLDQFTATAKEEASVGIPSGRYSVEGEDNQFLVHHEKYDHNQRTPDTKLKSRNTGHKLKNEIPELRKSEDAVITDRRPSQKNQPQSVINKTSFTFGIKKGRIYENIEEEKKNYSSNDSSIQINQFTEEVGNTEKKEMKERGEQMDEIINKQIEAQFQKSINKIREGTFKGSFSINHNQTSVGQKRSYFAKGKTYTIDEGLGVKYKEDQDNENLRNHSFTISPSRVKNTELSSPFVIVSKFDEAESRMMEEQQDSLLDINDIVLDQRQDRAKTLKMGKPPVVPLGQQPIGLKTLNIDRENNTSKVSVDRNVFGSFNREKRSNSRASSLGSINRAEYTVARESKHNSGKKLTTSQAIKLEISKQISSNASNSPNKSNPPVSHHFGRSKGKKQGYQSIQDTDDEADQKDFDEHHSEISKKQNSNKSDEAQEIKFDGDKEDYTQSRKFVLPQENEQEDNLNFNFQQQQLLNHKRSIKSVFSGTSNILSEELDERIANYEQQLEILYKKRQDQELMMSQSNVISNQSYNQKIDIQASLKPFIFQGSQPGDSVRINKAQISIQNEPERQNHQSSHQQVQNLKTKNEEQQQMHFPTQRENIDNMINQRSILKKQPSEALINEEIRQPIQAHQFNSFQSSPNLDSPSKKKKQTQQRASTILEQMRKEIKSKTLVERMIRQFNMKMFDKVILELRNISHSSEESQNLMSLSSNEQKSHEERLDAKRLGQFMFDAKGIDKQIAGMFFGEEKKFNQVVAQEFLRCFRFRKMSIDSCWRLIFRKTGLPKEGQQIVRLLTVFQDVYLEQNGENRQVSQWDKDTVFYLSIKLLDLNTNLHNPNVKPMLRYSQEAFVEQSMNIPALKSAFDEKTISEMYDRILNQPFENKISLHEKYFKRINELSYSLTLHGFESSKNKNMETVSNASGSQQFRNSGKKIIVNSQLSQQKLAQINQEKQKMFIDEGTQFTKYGRYGEPKQRLVYLNKDETEILWRDKMSSNKPRKMLVKELTDVQIGNDHTAVMRKQKIPIDYDDYCLSIIGKDRTLDLMIQNKKVIQMWCEKINRLINKGLSQKQQQQLKYSPDSPEILNQSEFELPIYQRDKCPEEIEDLWKVEILNNWQHYWCIKQRMIVQDKEINFYCPNLKQSITSMVESQPFSREFKSELSNNDHVKHIGQEQQKRKGAIIGCTPFSANKFKGLFQKKEVLVTLDQIWYRGLSNMARYFIWPLLIGNSLQINNNLFDQVSLQVQTLRNRFIQFKTNRHGLNRDSSIMSLNKQQPILRHSNLTSIQSEGANELAFEQQTSNNQADGQSISAFRLQQVPSSISDIVITHLDSYSKHMIKQFSKITRKVDKISSHFEEAQIIGDLAEIPVEVFSQVMIDVLCTHLVYKGNLNGLCSLNVEPQGTFDNAQYVSGVHKVLAPLVIVFLREQDFSQLDSKSQYITNVSQKIFTCFCNLTLNTSSFSRDPLFFMNHFMNDDLAQIQWRMDFFDKLFEKVLPKLHKQFKAINMKHEYFLHRWMMTMFCNVQGLEGIEFVLRIWDLYILHGEPILYCVALVILNHKLHKLKNAPMQIWLDFFSRIKKIKVPQQCAYYHIGSGVKRSNVFGAGLLQNEQEGGGDEYGANEMERGGVNISSRSNADRDIVDGDIIINQSSVMLIPMIQETIQIYYKFQVKEMFQENWVQQSVAEQKHELFQKMFMPDL